MLIDFFGGPLDGQQKDIPENRNEWFFYPKNGPPLRPVTRYYKERFAQLEGEDYSAFRHEDMSIADFQSSVYQKRLNNG